MATIKRQLSHHFPNNRRSLQGENKKRLILKVATEVFAERGFSESTISQIAQRAKISEGSIYDYFKNKEDLLFSIPEERMETFLTSLGEQLEGVKGALNKLRKLIWYHLKFYQKNRDYTRILLLHIRQNPRFNQSKAYGMIRQYSKMILQIIEEGKREGTIRREIDPYTLRDLILGSIEHFTIRGFLMGKFANLAGAADRLCDLITGGIEEKKRLVILPLEKLLELKANQFFKPQVNSLGRVVKHGGNLQNPRKTITNST